MKEETFQASETAVISGKSAHSTTSTTLRLGCIAVLAAAGTLGVYRNFALLWICWTTDPLRSIGILIPPISVLLTLRIWRRTGWKMDGRWWGLLVIALSYFLSFFQQSTFLLAYAGRLIFALIPLSLPVYLYGSGVVLLFAGPRVWRLAWFPLGLLLLSQPVPLLSNSLVDLPLQYTSARVARSFATLIGFAPTTAQLRLMFSPDFGMFIAPGCDGIRGAVVMGYVALLLGYLKRVSFLRWAAYVIGGILLGYLFNFVRLCMLVIYYRIAVGHPTLEGVAKQADYTIGSSLFLIATLLFLWIARRNENSTVPFDAAPHNKQAVPRTRYLTARYVAFALMLSAALCLPTSAVRYERRARALPAALAAHMPKQIGAFSLTRTWYEQQNGNLVVENGAYSVPGSDEVILGLWVGQAGYFHDANLCWLARGLHPDGPSMARFVTSSGTPVTLNTGFYSDGITDSIVLNTTCTPTLCSQFQSAGTSKRTGILFMPNPTEFLESGTHPVSIMVRIDRLHSDLPKPSAYSALSAEAQRFVSDLDLLGLSRAFQ